MPFGDYSSKKKKKNSAGFSQYATDKEAEYISLLSTIPQQAPTLTHTVANSEPSLTRGGAPRPDGALGYVTDFLDATLGRIAFPQESDPAATKALSRAIDIGGNIATVGASHALQSTPQQAYQPVSTGSDGLDTTADIIGTIGGYVGFGRGAGTLGVGQAVTQKVAQAAPRLPGFAQRTAGGAVEGLVAGMGEEFADYQHDFTGQDETAGQRLGYIALGAGLGGGISAVAEPISKGVGNWLQKLKKTEPEVVQQPILALPAPRNEFDSIIGEGPVLRNGFDLSRDMKLVRPGVSRAVNPAEEQLKALYKEAEARGLPPGREYEYLQSLWSEIAPRNAGSLDDLVEQASRPVNLPGQLQQLKARQERAAQYGISSLEGIAQRGTKETVEQQGQNSSFLMLGRSESPGTIHADTTITRPRFMPADDVIDITPGGQTPSFLSRITQPITEFGERLTGGKQSGFMPFARPKPYEASSTDTASQIVTRATNEKIPVNEWLETAYQKFVDDLRGIKRFENDVEDVLGRPLKPGEKAYESALNSRGSDMIARQILTNQLVDTTGQRVGASLRDILQPLPKGQLQRFEDYLTNKHAITRYERGEKVYADRLLWTPEKGAAKIAELDTQYPQFAKMADDLYAFQREVVNKWLVDTGLITEDAAKAWFEKNPFYVPNKRLFSELEKRNNGVSRARGGFVNQKAPVKEYQKGGSQRKIISPIEAIIENVEAFVKAAKRNEAGQALVRTLQQAPDDFKGWAEIVQKAPAKKVDVSNPDAIDDILTDLNNDFDKALQVQRLDHDNIVRVMVNGEPVHLKVNDGMLLDALTALGPSGRNVVADTVGKVTQMFKMFTTGANPIFTVTRNLPRDIAQSYVQSRSEVNPVTFMRDLTSAFIELLGTRGAAKDYRATGGGFTGPVSSDINQLARTKRQLLPQNQNVEITPVGQTFGKLAGPLKQPAMKAWYAFWDVMDAFESAPRLAEFKRIRAKNPEAGIMKALYEANEVSVNFKRRGSVGKEIDKFFPYFNAAVQGLDKLARTFKDDPAKAFTKAVMSISIPTMVLYALNRDNPDYQQLSQVDKDNNWLIPKGDGTFWKIAKPRELATMFSALPERTLRDFADQDPEAWDKFSKQLIEAFLPPGVSGPAKGTLDSGLIGSGTGLLSDTIGAPIIDLMANRNFMGTPIVPRSMENLPAQYQYDEQTTSLAKALGEATNTSPKKLDYVMRQYGGGLAELAQPLMQSSTGGDTALAKIGQTLKKKVTADPVYSNDITRNFYDIKEKLEQANAVFKQTGEKTPEYNDELRKQYNKAADQMGQLRKLARQVQNDEKLSADAKRDKLRELQKKTLDIAKKFN
ncbi:hypothetical protein ABH14_00390 [Brevibacillus brevis]|uniref:LPD38 domain-containing protein n=1 Tax=Brevibacillus brevis TaxID=1393 RepID=UPI00190206D9|nr:LPD38 domain-containing protein [Brevibacillus brevis]MBH0328270.1 hypothetical protein [Brevibacillus brevis]